jgi:hypothetical protein
VNLATTDTPVEIWSLLPSLEGLTGGSALSISRRSPEMPDILLSETSSSTDTAGISWLRSNRWFISPARASNVSSSRFDRIGVAR